MGVGFSQLSWSLTRHRSLAGACPRAHWFQYWTLDEPEHGRCKTLKRLTNLDMLAGTVVDRQVEYALEQVRAGNPLPPDLVERGLRTWERMLAASRLQARRLLEGQPLPYGAQPLMADYYGQPISDREIERCALKVESSLSGFMNCELGARLIKVHPCRWHAPRSEHDTALVEFQVEGIRIYAQIDFHMERQGHWLVIVDWKSSSRVGTDEGLQLAVCGLWGLDRGFGQDQVHLQAAHLPDCPIWAPKNITELEYDAARSQIVVDHQRESQLTEVRDRKGTPVVYADRAAFPPRPGPVVCAGCKFRAVCPEGQAITQTV